LVVIISCLTLLAILGQVAGTWAFYADTRVSIDNKATAWQSSLWKQTNRSEFSAGISSDIDITAPGDLQIAASMNSGIFTSQVFDTEGSGTRWDALVWDETVAAGTDILFEVRASDSPFQKDAASPFWSTSHYDSSPIQSGLPSGQYLQWRATLNTENASTPALSEVRVYYTSQVFHPAVQITDIGNISGSPQVGQTLTAGALTPSGATATYQWQRSAAAGGPYLDISGATGSTYSLVNADQDYYIRVLATGASGYKCSVASVGIGPVVGGSLTAIGAVSGITQVGQTLTAGALSPAGATANYQWQKCSTADGTYSDISGATAGTYTLTADDYGYYIRVVATGTGMYTGTVTSSCVGPVAAGQLTAISPIIGTASSGQTLTAGTVTPVAATVPISGHIPMNRTALLR